MGIKCVSVVVLLLAIVAYSFYQNVLAPVVKPDLDLNHYWGPGNRQNKQDSSNINPFKVKYSADVIENLRKRLSEPLVIEEPLEGVNFRYGFHKNKLEHIIKYWRDDYLPRWDERQKFLNSFPQYETEVQGLKIHFIHTKDLSPKGKQLVPLLLLHGWPGSVREFYELIPKLIATQKDVDFSFIVVAPSLPGYGFSQGASKPGLGAAEMAVVMRNLMIKLGYNRFLVQGGDWGSIIGSNIATFFPENVIGYHSNMCSTLSKSTPLKLFIASLYPSLFIPPQYTDLVFPFGDKFKYLIEESGYFHLQATKPDTIGIALGNNPVGLAAYILEKFSTWTNSNYRDVIDGGLEKSFSLDALFDNVMLYYLSNSITTSMRLYAESFAIRQQELRLERIPTNVPTGCARFRHDIMHELDWQLESKYHNLVHSTYHDNGGHFIALESPEELYKDFIHFVQKLKF